MLIILSGRQVNRAWSQRLPRELDVDLQEPEGTGDSVRMVSASEMLAIWGHSLFISLHDMPSREAVCSGPLIFKILTGTEKMPGTKDKAEGHD